ncbi:S1 family peptidase [Thaumasiovibrio subtropicus]|uniref:S1 family peptidase n=1 Tax=Thaumasiovibrio subtropicus TaxID=1891207 RepID=UPI00131AB613|nr:serine protease [Thaumasiovibrio subtropicus]
MKKYWLLGLSALPLMCNVATSSAAEITPYVVGGVSAEIEQHPWQLFLRVDIGGNEFNCGAVYIGNNYALSAAHCFEYQGAIASDVVEVYGGSVDKNSFVSGRASLATYVPHPDYNAETFINDIAVLDLSSVPDGVLPISIASTDEQRDADLTFSNSYVVSGISPENVMVSGWGKTFGNAQVGSDVLRHTKLTGVPDNTCSQLWEGMLSAHPTSYYVCAATPDPTLVRDTCQGDSGGPLIWQNADKIDDNDFGIRLIGLTSFGILYNYELCNANAPAVFTQVSSYSTFINANTPRGLPQATANYEKNAFDADVGNAGDRPGSGMASNRAGNASSVSFAFLVLCLLGIGRRRNS